MGFLRSFRRFTTFLICWWLTACSTFVTYPGPELPDEQVATFNCYSRYYFVYLESCRVQAVDGVRPNLSEMFGNTSKILPGSHWIEIAFEKYFGGGGGVSDVCAFDMVLQPGKSYQVKAHSLTTDTSLLTKHGSNGLYSGLIGIIISEPSGNKEVRNVRATCSAFGGSMCRKDGDCVSHPDIRCFPQEGFSFGTCGFKESAP